MKTLPIDADELFTKVSAYDVVDEATGEVILECNEEVPQEKVDELLKRGIKEFKVLFIDNLNVGPYLRDTLMIDKIETPEQAIMEIYRRLRPGDPPTPETASNLFNNLFFNPERYDLSQGRPPQAELQVRPRGAARRHRSSPSATSSRSSAT